MRTHLSREERGFSDTETRRGSGELGDLVLVIVGHDGRVSSVFKSVSGELEIDSNKMARSDRASFITK